MFRIPPEAAGAMTVDDALLWSDIDTYDSYMEGKMMKWIRKHNDA